MDVGEERRGGRHRQKVRWRLVRDDERSTVQYKWLTYKSLTSYYS